MNKYSRISLICSIIAIILISISSMNLKFLLIGIIPIVILFFYSGIKNTNCMLVISISISIICLLLFLYCLIFQYFEYISVSSNPLVFHLLFLFFFLFFITMVICTIFIVNSSIIKNDANKSIQLFLNVFVWFLVFFVGFNIIYSDNFIPSDLKEKKIDKYHSVYLEENAFPKFWYCIKDNQLTLIKTESGLLCNSSYLFIPSKKILLETFELNKLSDKNFFKDPNFIKIKFLFGKKGEDNLFINNDVSSKYSVEDIKNSLEEMNFYIFRKNRTPTNGLY